ncbi:hypothetical protein BGZ58_010969, partial [Dissophora ornata]
GCFLRYAGKSVWEDQVQQGSDMQWRKMVMEMFEYYKERTPGSEIEEKSVPLVWNPVDFVLCVGDDRSDEDMFQFVNGLKLSGCEQQQHRVVTCTVGSKSSEARWFVPGVWSVLQGLQFMADAGDSSTTEAAARTSSTAMKDGDELNMAADAVVPEITAAVE